MSDSYQAIYDAVRSRISGGNIGDAIESVARDAFDIGNQKQQLTQAIWAIENAATDHARPSAVYRPRIFPDGDQWCALYGENLQEGVCAFGDTPATAALQFDIEWLNAKAGSSHG